VIDEFENFEERFKKTKLIRTDTIIIWGENDEVTILKTPLSYTSNKMS